MSERFWDNVQKRAYYKYLNKMNSHLPEDGNEDWSESMNEETMDCKIAEEAYYNHLRGGGNPTENWEIAKSDIMDRIRFLAFYMHERDINKSPTENWMNAMKLYISKF